MTLLIWVWGVHFGSEAGLLAQPVNIYIKVKENSKAMHDISFNRQERYEFTASCDFLWRSQNFVSTLWALCGHFVSTLWAFCEHRHLTFTKCSQFFVSVSSCKRWLLATTPHHHGRSRLPLHGHKAPSCIHPSADVFITCTLPPHSRAHGPRCGGGADDKNKGKKNEQSRKGRKQWAVEWV